MMEGFSNGNDESAFGFMVIRVALSSWLAGWDILLCY